MNHKPVSPLDRLLIKWADLQPDRCQLDPDYPGKTINLVDVSNPLPLQVQQGLAKVYRVYTPHFFSYLTPGVGQWESGDWKRVVVGQYIENIDFTGMTHLMVGVCEAMVDQGLWSRDDGAPLISSREEAYPTCTMLLKVLLGHLDPSFNPEGE